MSKNKILVVDDDEILCDGISSILDDEGYTVVNTSSAIEAIRLINVNIFDLALLDYKMPDHTGVELLKIIKKENPQTRVYIMSGNPYIEKILQTENVFGIVEGILIKPFDDTVLIEKIK